MSLRQIALHDYDTVVAVTQNAVNEALAEFLDLLQKQVAIYYATDSQGNLIPVSSPAQADFIFTGTLDYALDVNGNPVDIVQLYNPDLGNQTVRYNVTFERAEFIAKPMIHVSQQPGAPPWIFRFRVNLALQESRLADLPPDIRAKVEHEVKNLGPDMFSIQQLYLDLNTAVFDSFDNVQGLTPIAAAELSAILQAYLAEQQRQGGIVFGYNVTYVDQTTPAPTFMPTDLNFCVTPYRDASGNTSNPTLDTLNYLIMTGHRPAPPYLPSGFPFNWVDDPSNQGALAINAARSVPFLVQALNPILTTLCPKLSVGADVNKSVYDQPMQLVAGDQHAFDLLYPNAGNRVASYSYSASASAHAHGPVWAPFLLDVSAAYSMSCDVSIVAATSGDARDRLRLAGSLTTQAEVDLSNTQGGGSVVMPATTYAWSVDLVLQIDLAQGGQLDLVLENADFDGAPSVAQHDESWWQRFLQGLSGQFASYVDSLGSLRDQVKGGIESEVMGRLQASLRSANHFVFPGGRSFVFKNPQFSDALDLASNITYLAPSTQAQPASSLPAVRSMAYRAHAPGRAGGLGAALTLQASTDLMKNQKAALLLPPRSQFAALQTSAGDALFFSIGDDGVFHLTVERPGASSGWIPLDLSRGLAVPGAALPVASTFAVAQNAADGTATLAVAVKGDVGGDFVYVLAGVSDAPDATWLAPGAQRPWLARPFDAHEQAAAPLDVAYLYLAQAHAVGQEPVLIAGLRDAHTGYVQNYSVSLDPDMTEAVWRPFQTAENYDQLLAQHVGKPAHAMYAGLYQLYELGGVTALVFVPMRALFGPPTITKLIPPDQAQALAVIPNGQGSDTDLYVGAEGGIYLYAAGAQGNGAQGVKIIDSPMISAVRHLAVRSSPTQVFLWGLSRNGQVFYSRCPKGREADPRAWSCPIPIEQGVQHMASLLNHALGANEVFAHTSGQQLVRLTQDPLTTLWRERSLLLPPLTSADMVERMTYTTHLELSDENGLPSSGTGVWISSTSPCNVYVNDLYTSLLPNVPLEVMPDENAAITIVQEVQSLAAVTYNVHGADGVIHNINPMKTVTERMAAVKSGTELGRINITDEHGRSEPLVPPSVAPPERDAAAQWLQNFATIEAGLPQDGSVQQPTLRARARVGCFDLARDRVWAQCGTGPHAGYHEGARALEACGLTLLPSGSALCRSRAGAFNPIGDALRAEAGDIFRWLRHAYSQASTWLVHTTDGVVNFFIQIADRWYHFFMICIGDVLHAAEFVLRRLEVVFEAIARWLGFVFGWSDILRTHAVLCNIVQQYVKYAVARLPHYRQQALAMFDGVQQRIDAWAGLEGTGGSLASLVGATPPGRGSPQANWGLHQLKANVSAATTDFAAGFAVTDALRRLLGELLSALKREGAAFQRAYETIETQIVGQFEQLTAGEIIRRILAVLADVLVASASNVVVTTLDVLEIVAESMLGALTATLHVPVLSPLYKALTGNDLSILDLCCLIVATPATILYKALRGRAPFPDDALTSALTSAKTFEELQAVYAAQAVSTSAMLSAGAGPDANPNARDVLQDLLALCASFGAACFILVSLRKIPEPDSMTYALAHFGLFLTATAPNVAVALLVGAKQSWVLVVAETLYSITVLQKLVDVSMCLEFVRDLWGPVTRGLDAVLGVAGMLPAIGGLSLKQTQATEMAFVAASFWNFNRMLTPFADPKTRPRVFGVKMAFVLGYGLLIPGALGSGPRSQRLLMAA